METENHVFFVFFMFLRTKSEGLLKVFSQTNPLTHRLVDEGSSLCVSGNGVHPGNLICCICVCVWSIAI